MVKNIEKLFSLPRRSIIKSSNDIRDVLKTGYKRSGRTVNIYFQTSEESKFAVLTPKRIGKANQRNKMKRFAREVYRQNPQWFNKQIVIFFIKKIEYSYTNFKEEIGRMVTKK